MSKIDSRSLSPFGQVLSAMQEGVSMRGGSELIPAVKNVAVVRLLEAADYSMSSGSYSLLSTGHTLPRVPAHFLAVISRETGFNLNTGEMNLVAQAYDVSHSEANGTLGVELPPDFAERVAVLRRGGRLPEVEDPDLRAYYTALRAPCLTKEQVEKLVAQERQRRIAGRRSRPS